MGQAYTPVLVRRDIVHFHEQSAGEFYHRSGSENEWMLAQIDPSNRRRLSALNSLLLAKPLERFVDVRQVVCRHVVHKCARDLVTSHSSIEPAKEQDELHQHYKAGCPPMRGARRLRWCNYRLRKPCPPSGILWPSSHVSTRVKLNAIIPPFSKLATQDSRGTRAASPPERIMCWPLCAVAVIMAVLRRNPDAHPVHPTRRT